MRFKQHWSSWHRAEGKAVGEGPSSPRSEQRQEETEPRHMTMTLCHRRLGVKGLQSGLGQVTEVAANAWGYSSCSTKTRSYIYLAWRVWPSLFMVPFWVQPEFKDFPMWKITQKVSFYTYGKQFNVKRQLGNLRWGSGPTYNLSTYPCPSRVPVEGQKEYFQKNEMISKLEKSKRSQKSPKEIRVIFSRRLLQISKLVVNKHEDQGSTKESESDN